MTRRLILLDLTESQYLTLRETLFEKAQSQGIKTRKREQIYGIVRSIQSSWDAKGREGRGYNTKLPKV